MAHTHSHTDHAGQHGSHEGDHHEFSHPAPLSMLFGVFAALVVLTIITVAQSQFKLGNLEIWLTLGIATVKAGLVILFFMHLLWDKPLNVIIILSSLIFVGLFLGFTLMDMKQYEKTFIDQPIPVVQTETNS